MLQDLSVYLSSLLDTLQEDSITAHDREGYSLTHWVAVTGDVELMSRVSQSGFNLNQFSEYEPKLSPAYFAIKYGHVNLVEYLLAKKVSPSELDLSGNNMVHHAANLNQVAILRILVNLRQPMNLPNEFGYYPLHCAAHSFAKDAFQFLIANNFSIDQPSQDGYLLTHTAIEKNNLPLCKLLAENNANFNSPNSYGEYPLHMAAMGNFIELVDFLLSLNVPLNQVDGNKKMALNLAIKKGHVAIVKKLLFFSEQGRSRIYFQRNHSNGNPLIHTMIKHLDDADLLGFLHFFIEQKIFVWWYNSKNESPVMLAVNYGKVNTLKFLLANHEKIKAIVEEGGGIFEPMIQQQSHLGYAPIHYAITQLMENIDSDNFTYLEDNLRTIFEILKRHGASYSQYTGAGTTARQMLYMSTPKNQKFFDLWREIVASSFKENENQIELIAKLSYLTSKEEINIITSLLRNILKNDQLDIQLNHLRNFLNRDPEQKFKLIIVTCALILKLYSCINNSEEGILSNFALVFFEELCEEHAFDLHEFFAYQTILNVVNEIIKKISDKEDIDNRFFASLFDNYLYFVSALFPKYYLRCLYDLSFLGRDYPAVRLILRHGLAIRIGMSESLIVIPETDHLKLYQEAFQDPFNLFISEMPAVMSSHLQIEDDLAFSQEKYLAETGSYSEYKIASYLHIYSSMLIDGGRSFFSSQEMIEIKNAFFYFFLLSENLSKIKNTLEEDKPSGEYKFPKKDDDDNIGNINAGDLYQLKGVEHAILSASKKLVRNMNGIHRYFSFYEKFILHQKIYQSFPTLTHLCINKLCETDKMSDQNVIDQDSAEVILTVFNGSKNINYQSHFLKQLGLFTQNRTKHIIAVEYDELFHQVVHRGD
jgi:ankyrin repeat protein